MDQNPGSPFLHERDLEPRVLPKQYQNIHHVLYLLGYNTGAKFQLLCFIIYRDITDFVFLHQLLSKLMTSSVT